MALLKGLLILKKKRVEVSFKPTGFCVKAYGRGKVQVKCDYIPGVWIRQFDGDYNSKEWLSKIVSGSRAVETIYGLEAGEVYIFRIVNIGHNNQRVYSEEITHVVP